MRARLRPSSQHRPRAGPRGRCRERSRRCRRATRSFHINSIILDQDVGEQLVGGLLERRLGLLAAASLDLDVEHLALAHARHAGDPERFERTLDRLALGIEDTGFERDGDARFHAIPIFLIGTPPSIWPESPAAQAPAAQAAAAAPTCPQRAKSRGKPPQCTGAAARSRRRPRPATWPLSPTSRSAAQNAACVLATTGMPWRASSGAATPSVRKPPQEISRPSAAGASPQALEPSAMMSASLLLPGSPKPNRPKPSSASTSKPCAVRKALSRLLTSSAYAVATAIRRAPKLRSPSTTAWLMVLTGSPVSARSFSISSAWKSLPR